MDSKVKEFYYQEIRNGLQKCTESQRQFFDRLYPSGIENIEDDRLDWALQQVKRTIAKNEKKQQEV